MIEHPSRRPSKAYSRSGFPLHAVGFEIHARAKDLSGKIRISQHSSSTPQRERIFIKEYSCSKSSITVRHVLCNDERSVIIWKAASRINNGSPFFIKLIAFAGIAIDRCADRMNPFSRDNVTAKMQRRARGALRLVSLARKQEISTRPWLLSQLVLIIDRCRRYSRKFHARRTPRGTRGSVRDSCAVYRDIVTRARTRGNRCTTTRRNRIVWARSEIYHVPSAGERGTPESRDILPSEAAKRRRASSASGLFFLLLIPIYLFIFFLHAYVR